MEKMKRRSAWMRIMAVMLALVTGITMMPLDTFAAAGKDSGRAYLQGSEETADESMTDKAYLAESGHSHDNCGCSECYDHEDCNCDGCGDNDVCDCEECSRYDTSTGNDRITPYGAACYHENIEYEEGDCWFHYEVCTDCGKRFVGNHSGPYYGQDGTCECGLAVHNYGAYGDTYRTFAHEWSYASKGDILHTKTCTKCGTSWVERHYGSDDTCVCGHKFDEHQHGANWSLEGHDSYVNMDCATHSFTCDECGKREIELHYLAYYTDGKPYCVCHAEIGTSGPTYYNTHKYEYVSVNDEIHQYVCSKCGYVHIKSPHHFSNGNICSDCGYEGQNTTATPPTAKTGLVYNAKIQTGVEAGIGYTLTGNTAKDAGDYTATATLSEGYTWTDGSTDAKEIAWSIAPAELTKLLVLSETTFLYNGAVQKPEIGTVWADNLYVPDTDYTLQWSNESSREIGSYTVTATGKNNYTGTATVTYTISDGKLNLEECKVTGLKEDSSARYTEEEMKNIGLESKDGKKLTEGEEYTVSKKIEWVSKGWTGEDVIIITFEPKGDRSKGKKKVVVKEKKPGTYTLTIDYIYLGGAGQAAPTYTRDFPNGSFYCIESPEVQSFNPSKKVVAGSSDNGVDVHETVTYAGEYALCGHNYGRTYLDTGNNIKHRVFCDFCMAELPEAEHNKTTGPLVDENDKPTGEFVVFCKECGHIFEVSDRCWHDDVERRRYVDNKDDRTHSTYCGQCGILMNDVSPHVIEETPLGPVGEGMYQNPGAYVEKCTRCGWQKKHICYHEGQEVYYRQNPGSETHTHRVLCKRCNGVVEPREVCAFGEWLAANEKSHVRACGKCEYYEVAEHTPGPRKFYKWEKKYLNYYLYYYQGCLENCGLHTENKIIFKGGGATFLAPYERYFDMLTKGDISLGEAYKHYLAKKGGAFGKGVDVFCLIVPTSRLVYWGAYALFPNAANNVAVNFLDFEKDIADARPVETRALYTDAQGRVMEVPIKHKDDADVDPDHSSGPAPLQAGGSVPEYDDTKVVYDFSSMTKEEIESMFFLVDAPALLEQNNTGDHTVLMTVEVTDENGNQLDGIATEYDYRISEIDDPDTGEKVKAISDMIPEGLMYDFDKGIAELGIEESDQVIELTGKEAATAPVPVLKLCPSDGTESAVIPANQYTLSCRKITVDADGNETAAEADRNAITEPGTYCLTATPVEESEWKGSASVDFRAAYALEGLVTVSDIGNQGYTGAPIEPEVVVTTDMGVELARGGQYVYGKGSDGEDAYVRQEEADYALSYKDNVNAGTASVIVTGTGNYCGSVTKEFTILPADLGDCVMESILPQAYTGKALKPEVQVYSTRTYEDGKEARTELQNGVDFTTVYADNREPGDASVTLTGMGNYTGTLQGTFEIYLDQEAEAVPWNLFEDGGEHIYTVSGITSKNEVANSNTSSAKYFTAALSKDKITVNLKEGADRKKAAAANVFDFDLGEEGAVSYTLPLTYNKPVFRLSSAKGTVKKGTEATLKTTVLYQDEDGSFIPYDLSEAVVIYGRQTLTGGADGSLSIRANSKASDSIRIGMEGWNEQDPVALKYTISETAANKDVLTAELGGLKQVILNTNAPEQSFTFPLTLNGEDASGETVEIVKGKKGEENLAQIGNGTVTVSLGRSGIGKGSYTITLKPVKESKARATIKVKVTDKAMTASGKIALKMDVVTKKPMIVIPQIKQGSGQITGAEVTGITLKKGTPKPASAFKAEVKGSYIEVSYAGSEEMTASDLKIGDMALALTVEDTEGNEVKVPLTLKSVTAKKTTPTVRSGKVVIPKALAEKADGTFVIASANILSTYKDSAKHVRTIEPVSAELIPKNVVAEVDPDNAGRILIKKLNGKSGSVKVKVTYPGGVTKTVTIKVSKGKK